MEHRLLTCNAAQFPPCFHSYIQGAAIYDSSCSNAAQVFFLDKEDGFYLKTAPKGTLQKEAELYRYFHMLGYAPEVVAYESLESDWLLTVRAKGDDCIAPHHLADPTRLTDTVAQALRMLHETSPKGCPAPNHTAAYLATARKNYLSGCFDPDMFPQAQRIANKEEAWRIVEENGSRLQTDTLLHGDYCLPNIILHNWKFSSFIDLDHAGVGDRHVDIFWALWSLEFNLKTDRFRDRFLDAYGRDLLDETRLQTVAAIEVFG